MTQKTNTDATFDALTFEQMEAYTRRAQQLRAEAIADMAHRFGARIARIWQGGKAKAAPTGAARAA